ncbi:ester cyclase [Myceligenerans indicum]|uniref:Ester cyclase n=1 Tax=Myceligenerans indicum TaxID=2593663 RepID=A0ABS1LNY6_9MICO|nr:ester cyclase [Myceligenerans indicum]MBL0887939.1 ester cyclase [Myceligenerans indicum]
METTEKSVVRRFYEIVGSGRPEVLDEVCSAGLKGHAGAGSDLQELKNSVASLLAAFPDLTPDVRHLVQEGDLVSTWVSYTGTHQADFAGVPAGGRRVKFAAWDLIRVEDGEIVEITQYCDLFTIMSQIGALPTAAPA